MSLLLSESNNQYRHQSQSNNQHFHALAAPDPGPLPHIQIRCTVLPSVEFTEALVKAAMHDRGFDA